MSYYVRTLVERTNAYDCYLVKPNFTPRKAGTAFDEQVKDSAASGSAENNRPASVKDLTNEQKQGLLDRLHRGQGDLSLQEWDDFLADLVDIGLISNDERMYANGLIKEIPQEAQSGEGYCFTSAGPVTPEMELDAMWTGDPLKWLDDMDLYMLKYELYSRMECRNTTGISHQRDAYKRVAQIVREILG